MKKLIRKLTWSSGLIMLQYSVQAQAPDFVPYGDPEPVEWTLFNIILLIVIPILIFIAFIFIKKNRNKKG